MEIVKNPKKIKLFKYEIEANKKAKHMKTKSYAEEQAKKQYKKDKDAWNLAVKTRDNWTCQICGKYVKENPHNCHEHHIFDKTNFKEFAIDVMNGITLCYRDHKVGELSPHMNALFFAIWLEKNKPEQYAYIFDKLIAIPKIREYLLNGTTK